MKSAHLTESQKQRFARQIALPEIGEHGQQRLLAERVLLVGAGGLGSAAGLYLAAAGLGTIGIVDNDVVELENLQRQVFYTTTDIGRAKTEAAADKIRALHPAVDVRIYSQRLNPDNAKDILSDYNFIIDATDNMETKKLLAEFCHSLNKVYSYGGVFKYYGQTLTVYPGKTACLQCLFADLLMNSQDFIEQGPIGIVPGVIGVIQAAEAIKYFLDLGASLTGRLLIFDACSMQFRNVRVNRNPACPLCRD